MATPNGTASRTVANGSAHKKESVTSKISSLAQAIYTSLSPLPQYPYTPGNNDNAAPQTGLLQDIQKLGFEDYRTLLMFLNTSVTGVDDDNKLLLERLVQLLSKLPPHSKERKELTDGFINQLWAVLEHPPVSSLGNQYKYREPDGSYNNINAPQLGAANTPYARTVTSRVFQNPDLPDPTVIFDSLMARGDTFHPHPNGISSMLFYMATIIIHDVFQTSQSDFNINMTSSYLDLAPLYGRNAEEQKAMRTFKDGLLKPDCWSSTRIHGFPPGCGVFLIMFNRFHNYVVTQLALINEKGRFTKPSPGASKAAWTKYDNDLFQTGRLITGGLYVNIILKDYVRTILSLNRTDSAWSLDPRTEEGKNIFSKGAPAGVGNQVSVEFNLIYRWHSTISPRDEQWTIDELKRLLNGKDPETASMQDVVRALGSFEASLPKDPEQRTFAGLQRLSDGTYDDDSLVKIFKEGVEDIAGSFGANRVPRCMKAIEVLGVLQARYWNLGTLNEFRAFVGLTRHHTFEDINPDPQVALKLKQLYDSPDSVEMYPGIVAEKTKPPMSPGSGLCVNVSTSRAILSDAVALTRGDRFYTIDYTPNNLTNWGFHEVDSDATIDLGHVMHKLIFRAFPKHFVRDSIYAHFPFVVPAENKKIHDDVGDSWKYSWEAPKRHLDLMMVKSYNTCKQILDNQEDFKTTVGESIRFLTNKDDGTVLAENFCLVGDEAPNAANHNHIKKCLYPSSAWERDIGSFFEITTDRLMNTYSYPVSTNGSAIKTREVDVVRDVISLATTHFSAALWSLPIKTQATPHGIYSEQQLYQVLVAIFSCIFFDADIGGSFRLHTVARELAQQLGKMVMVNAEILSPKGEILDSIVHAVKDNARFLAGLLRDAKEAYYAPNGVPHFVKSEWPALKLFGDKMIERMIKEEGWTLEEAVWGSILPTSAAGCCNQTGVLSQAIEYYIGDGSKHLPALYALAHEGTKEADEKLMKYMLEGVRLRGTVAVYRDLATAQTITDYSPSTPNPADPAGLNPLPNPDPARSAHTFKLPAGSRILVDLAAANHDASVFPDPEAVRLDRPVESYMQFGWGPHQCVGQQASRVGLTALFKQVVGRRNLRRADSVRGRVKSFPVAPWNGQVGRTRNPDLGWTGLRAYLTADQSQFWPVPSTLKVRWDE